MSKHNHDDANDTSQDSTEDVSTHDDEQDEMLPEYDFSGAVRGKYAAALQSGYKTVVHHADGTVTEVVHVPGEPSGVDARNARSGT